MRKPLILLSALALAGCMTTPTIQQIKTELPSTWPAESTATASEATASVAVDWWKAYNDPALNALVAEALQHNRDLQSAAARIEEVRANLGLTDADRFPEVALGGDVARSKASGKGNMPSGTPLLTNTFSLNLQASWEVDLWGRYRHASAAARADLLATEYARQAIQSTLISTVANSYFALAALDARIQLTQNTLANRRQAVDLQRLRLQNGISSELAMRQAEAEQALLETGLSQLQQQLRQQELALALLLGREPGQLVAAALNRGPGLEQLTLPPAIPAGLPSDLLQRRPDLRQAEQRLLGSQARIRETAAALYPNLSLTSHLGTESKALSDLFSGASAIWGLAAGLGQTLFNAGRTEAAMAAADARQTQALIAYQHNVQVAFKEVLDALIAHRQSREIGLSEARRVEALERTTQLVDIRFRNGISNYLEVLDAHRNLYQAKQGSIEARRAQLSASADLFKALGGGWE